MATTTSTTDTTPAATTKIKPHKAEQWEIDAIGKFLLELYLNLVFGLRSEWMVSKTIMRTKLFEYLQRDKMETSSLRERLMDANGTVDAGTLLHRTNYLINTPRGAGYYLIRSASLFQYSNKAIEDFDEKRKNGETRDFIENDNDESKSPINGDPALIDSLQVDDNAPTHELLYEGTQQQEQRATGFQLTNMGCYICLMNFGSPASFEEHVEEHNDESDFKILKNYIKSASPIFKISYNVCKNSHYFRFNLESARRRIVIEKLVIVQTRTFYYVHNTRVPYALGEDCKDNFFVDSHLFRKGIVQPIVVVFHEQSNKQKRYVEQHHFCRLEEFPVVKLSINPCRLSNKLKFKQKFKLPQYMPPVEVRRALQNDLIEASLCDLCNDFRDYLKDNKTLTQQNIRAVLFTLLQVEDWDTIREYSSLVQRNAKIRKYDNEYIIKVKTPKHIRSENIIFPYDDVILLPTEESTIIPNNLDDLMNKMDQLIDESSAEYILKSNNKKKTKCYYGQIKTFSYGRVTFACDQKIPDEKTFTVLFRPSRMVIRYQYRALEQLVAMPPLVLKKFLFPEAVRMQELPPLKLKLHNESIYSNPEQYQAIQCIVNNSVEKTAPYILFGPPGTGKTTTLVEAIYQIYMLQPQARILITAGSNGACDEIALRLCKILAPLNETKTITRIYSRARENRSENINELLLEYSNLYAEHFLPDINVLHSYRIVVCTLSIIGRLSTGKFGKEIDGSGVFTHVFVDEVAASTEAETLVGIMSTLSADACLVLSGDHRQLGPILNSQRATDLGLEVSLMERLLKRDCYQVGVDGSYNQQIQTRLCRNFRSHPEIVNLYSEMYYEGRLKAVADTDVQNLCRDWHRAPNPKYPIIFHSIFGPEQRDLNSTSRYNPLEISTVLDYVRDLLYFGIKGHKIVQSDIGIITPYKKQYMRIQDELNLRNWYQIECGAVETFQGKEKNIIIVSFVRSFTNTLGFLDSPKRLNVTLSRARSLLILIGNPRTLSINNDFKHVIEKCQMHKTLVGAMYRDSTNGKNANNAQMQKLNKSMEKLSMSKENITSENDAAKSKKSGNHRRRGKKGNNAGVAGGAATPKTKESTTAADDALKNKNSSTFKTVKSPSAEKQRQTFAVYKDLCWREAAAANFHKNNDEIKRNEIDDLLNGLPRVPTKNAGLQQNQQQHPLHMYEDHFEIINVPLKLNTTTTTTTTTNHLNVDHEQIQERIDKLLRKPKTQIEINVQATTTTTTNARPLATATSGLQAPTTTPKSTGYINKPNAYHLMSENVVRANPILTNTTTRTQLSSGIAAAKTPTRTAPAVVVAEAATARTPSHLYSCDSSFVTSSVRQPDRVAFGRTELPTRPTYVRNSPKLSPPPPPQPPKAKSSKKTCIIA